MDYQKYKKVPNCLKLYRKRLGLSQKEIAEQLDIDPNWISHWENGDALPSLVSAIRLSISYRTVVNDLFSDLVKTLEEEISRDED